jgi:hypothetical protein
LEELVESTCRADKASFPPQEKKQSQEKNLGEKIVPAVFTPQQKQNQRYSLSSSTF